MDTYEEQLSQLPPELRERLERQLTQAPTGRDDEAGADLASLMAEPAGGHLHGRVVNPASGGGEDGAGTLSGDSGSTHDVNMNTELRQFKAHWNHPERIKVRKRPGHELGLREITALDMIGVLDGNDRGYIAHAKAGEAGLRAHRGVTHPDEWVERAEVVREIECGSAAGSDVSGSWGL